jgi:hypothetical protein
MKKIKTILYVSLMSMMVSRVMAGADPYQLVHDPEFQKIQEKNMVVEIGRMKDQYDELQKQTKHMQQVIEKLGDLNSRDVDGYLNEITTLTNESNDLMTELEDKTKYEDFGANQRANYGKFYDDNTDKTMGVLNNSTETIQKNADENTPKEVSDVLNKARTDVNSDSYIKSMTALADINAEIVKELQLMRAQLTAVAQSQNAVAAKKIQEDAAEKQEFDLIIETSAVHKDIPPYPLEDPVF